MSVVKIKMHSFITQNTHPSLFNRYGIVEIETKNFETLSFDSQHYAAFGELFMKCLFCCFNEIFNEKVSLSQAQKQVAIRTTEKNDDESNEQTQ